MQEDMKKRDTNEILNISCRNFKSKVCFRLNHKSVYAKTLPGEILTHESVKCVTKKC